MHVLALGADILQLAGNASRLGMMGRGWAWWTADDLIESLAGDDARKVRGWLYIRAITNMP